MVMLRHGLPLLPIEAGQGVEGTMNTDGDGSRRVTVRLACSERHTWKESYRTAELFYAKAYGLCPVCSGVAIEATVRGLVQTRTAP